MIQLPFIQLVQTEIDLFHLSFFFFYLINYFLFCLLLLETHVHKHTQYTERKNAIIKVKT